MSTPPPSPGAETVAASADFSEPLEPLADDWAVLSSDTDVDALDTAQLSTLRAKGAHFLCEWLSQQTTLLLGAALSTPPPEGRPAITKVSVLADVLRSEDYTATLRSWAPDALAGDIRAAVRVLRLYSEACTSKRARDAWRSIRKMSSRHPTPPSSAARPSKVGGRPSKAAVVAVEPAVEVSTPEAPPSPPSPLPSGAQPAPPVPFALSPLARSIDLDLLSRCAPASSGTPGSLPLPPDLLPPRPRKAN